jgi:thioredoxin-related protein
MAFGKPNPRGIIGLIDRRRFTGLTLAALAIGPAAALAQTTLKMNEDGLYEEDWFLQSFLNLSEDLSDASEAGKRLAIMWELEGCPYCKETHLVTLARPDIRNYLQANFAILQLNLGGARLVTDFDGEEMSERKLARKWGVRASPTVMFMPQSAGATQSGRAIEVARMPGYFRPPHFFAMFRYVRENAYQTTNFRSYLRAARKK